MVFTRLFSSRSFKIAQKLTNMSARQTQISKRFIREVPRQMPLHDISAAECIAWVVLGGGPILYMGIHFGNELLKLADDCESGRLAPGTGPEYRLTNDQWLALKEEYLRVHGDEDEEDEMEDAVDAPSPVISASSATVDEAECAQSYGKDKVLFIDAPQK